MVLKKLGKHILILELLATTGVIVSFASHLAYKNENVITQYLGQENYKVINTKDSDIDTEYFKSEYNNMKTLQADETKFAEQCQAEGSVLLQNKGLPLKGGKKVTLLGSGSADSVFYAGGGGSAAIDASKKPALETVFKDAGFDLNPTMISFYKGAGKTTRNSGNNVVGEADLSLYTEAELSSFNQYKDAAIVVIGRLGQEGSDVQLKTKEDATKHMLQFSDNELALIDLAIEKFGAGKVTVLLNTMNPMECGPLLNKDVSILWIGAGGEQGLRAIPKLLDGTYNPSGKLVDTYCYDNYSHPSMQNFGNFSFSNIDNDIRKFYYNYAENIYIGYKYFETRYADKVLDQGNAGSFNYANEVVYPFGFGLSYTTFEYEGISMKDNGKNLDFEVTVKNTGSVKGKEAVQLYMSSPYTQYDIDNGIEKSAVELVGFAKTNELEAGKSEKVKISVPKEYMRTFDAKGHKGYIVEAGEYLFSAGKNVHDANNNVLAYKGRSTANGMTENGRSNLVTKFNQSKLDAETYNKQDGKEKVTTRFEDASYTYFDSSFKYLTRHDWTGTYPTPLGGESHSIEASAKLIEALAPEVIKADATLQKPITGANNGITLASLIGVDYDSEYWDKLLDQMTPDEMNLLVSAGGFATVPIKSISKPGTVEKDGPAGVAGTLIGGIGCFGYPIPTVMASTWNIELERQLGNFYGNDALLSKVPGVYAPSVNQHRTPFSGRNFEYFSEDSLQSGLFAAAMIEGLNKHGVYSYTKHFALNDQELNRECAATFATEQAIREIYLRPFEIAVRNGKSHGIMTAKNRVGTKWNGACKELLTDVLRGEWGFVGHVVTDHTTKDVPDYAAKIAVHNGLDLFHASAGTYDYEDYKNSAQAQWDLRRACHNILYSICNSCVMNYIAPDAKVVPITPTWKKAVIAVDIAGGVLLVGLAGLTIFFMIKKSRKEQ